MREIATISFIDPAENDEAVAIVRAATGLISLSLSLMHNGDLDIALPVADCDRLIKALQTTLAIARGSKPPQ